VTVSFHTLGCKLNQFETESLADSFRRTGCTVTSAMKADLFVVNTCTVTSKSEQKARRLIRRLCRANPAAVVITTGCYAQLGSATLRRLAPNVLTVPQDRKTVLHALAERLGGRRHSPERTKALLRELSAGILSQDSDRTAPGREDPFNYAVGEYSFHSRAFLKIQDGCDCRCSYCRVPLARGSSVSLDTARVLEKVTKLETAGYPEVVLTGVNISSYIRREDAGSPVTLATLLERILARTKNIRVRLSSLEPDRIDEHLLEVLQDNRVCPHFHIPVQSGSDRILARMRRRYQTTRVREIFKELRNVRPSAFLAADFIVGFPGETEEDFAGSRLAIEELEPAQLHVFPFSARPGTQAFDLRPKVASGTIRHRVHELLTLSNELHEKYQEAWKGRKVRAVLEGHASADGVVVALSDNYLRVAIHGLPEREAASSKTAQCLLEEPGLPYYKARYVPDGIS
jgi:threonylcarbamoyladenosine tRNA methylthiotransferase MtaB